MLKRSGFALLLMVLLLSLALAACRRDDEVTPTPTPAPRETEVVAEPTAAPTVAPTRTPGISGPSAIAPEDIDWPPQVIYSSPAPGEEVVLDGAITVRFDQPMDQERVEAAFGVFPADGTAAVAGTFNWPRPDTVIFTPSDRLKQAENYRVRIAETAAGLNGQTLPDVVELELATVGYLAVSQVIPADGVQGVQTDGAITVLFNRPVVPLVSTGQQADLPQPLTIQPAVAGEGQWVSTSIYRFVPDEPFAGATRYQVTVNAGLEDMTGGVLAEDFQWSFTTLNPSVVSIEPPSGTSSFVPTGTLTVTFNMPMDRASTEAAINLDPPASLQFNWNEDGRVVGITPEGMLTLDSRYRLTVAQSARSASGGATLDQVTESSFTTVPFPGVVNTYPRRGEEVRPYQNGFSVEFASPMDMSTIRDRIQIQPAPDEVEYHTSEVSNYLSVSFDMARNTEYVITIPGTAADPYGNTLGEPYSWRFRTVGYPPLISLNLSPVVSQLSTSHPTEVTVVHRNISQLEAQLERLQQPLDLLMEPYRIYDRVPSGELVWSESLSFRTERDVVDTETLSLAEGGTLPTGVYYLSLDAPEANEEDRYWQNRRNLLIVADTNLVVKEMSDAVYVWATDLDTGAPARGLSLTLYNYDQVNVGTAVTDANGLARFDYDSEEDYLRGVLVISNEPGEEGFGIGASVWNETAQPWQFNINYTTGGEPPLFGYLYTDRPIYRPGDTVHFRGIVRNNQYGRYSLPDAQSLTVVIQEEYYGIDGEPFRQDINVTLDENGNFSGEFTLPEGARLSSYQMFFEEDRIQAFRSFSVAEYRRPEFMVTVTADKSEALRDEPVQVTVDASYFFGGPATDLPVRWTVFEERHFLFHDGPYSFTDADNFYFYDPFGGFGPVQNEILSGQGRTNSQGQLVIDLPANLLEEIENGSRQVTVEATVLDVSEFGISARTNIVYHPAAVYVGVTPADYLGQAGVESEVELLTVDWDGEPVPSQPVELVFYQREWESVEDREFGPGVTRWEPVDTEVDRVQVTTDADGEATASFVPPEGGTYKIAATVTDAAGRQQTSSTFLWVTDSSFVGWRTAPRERRMELVADRQMYAPGETAQLLVQSPFTGPVQAWVTVERGNDILEQRVVTLESNSDVINVPVQPEHAPNVFVTVVVVKGIDEDNQYTDIRLGLVELPVSTEHLALNLSLTPQTDLLAPGETVTYDIRVTDYQGRPVQADLSLALVDLAVLTLKPDNAPPILEAFYSPQPYRSQLGAGLFISGEGLELQIPEEALGLGGGGGGEAAADEAVALRQDAQDAEETVRRDFPDTAFWRAVVQTDADGHAIVEIPLPDTTTTWRLSSKAITRDSLVGQASVDVVATLPLLVRSVTPRFFTVGDVVQIGAVINNTTNASMDVAVTLEAAGVTLSDGGEQGVVVPAGGSQLVRWEVRVEDVEFVDLTFRAQSEQYSDATKPSFGVGPDQLIPVYRYDAQDLVGTSGLLDETGRRVEAVLLPPAVDTRRGELVVQLSPSLGAAVLDALDYLDELEQDPVCAHGVMHQLLPNVAAIRALRELNVADPELESRLDNLVQTDLDRLETLQKRNGGWGWCDSEESDPYVSSYILLGLLKAQEAGYRSNATGLQQAIQYVTSLIEEPERLSERFDIDQQAFYLYVLAEAGRDVIDDADALMAEHRALLDPHAKGFLALAYELNGRGGSNNQQALLSDLNDSVVLSASGAHWEDAGERWNSLSSDIRGTAVIVDALARIEPDHALAPQAVRWLMAARTAGHWSSPYETVWSVLALTDWMVATGELDAGYDYLVNVNGQTLDEGQFSRTNILGSRTLTVPVEHLLLEEINFVDFQRGAGDGRLYYTAYLDSFIAAETVTAVDRGIIVQRTYYDAACDPETETCEPIAQIEAGQTVRVELNIIAPHDLLYVVVEDPIPAGAEAIDPGLSTSRSMADGRVERVDEDYRYGYWGWWYFNQIQFRDEKVVFTSSFLPAGSYQYTYTLQTTIPGEYQVMPAIAYQEFFPDVFGRSEGMRFSISD